jgi:tRNA A37 threonylcarbamoyladenosine biosynthesis protein TsaE
MQESQDFFIDTYESIPEEDMRKVIFSLIPWDRILLIWDLGSGKSTLVRALLRYHFDDPTLIVRSPTYTYYQRYGTPYREDSDAQDAMKNPENVTMKLWDHETVYHFDLYRVESYNDLFLIGALDILEDPTSICLIEWPEILAWSIAPTVTIHIERVSDTERRYTISRKK